MDREQISHLAHVEHALAAPVSEAVAHRLLGRLTLPQGGSVLDLGCGQGAWLQLLAAARPDLRLLGVDTSATALAEARATASRSGYRQTEFMHADAATVEVGQHDAVLCIGASHAFGGLDETLRAVRERMKPGGHVLLGDTVWEQLPTQAAQDAVGAGPAELPDLVGLVNMVRAHGFELSDGHASTLEEWDDYEWAWTGALIRWALEQPDGADREAAMAAAQGHRQAWLAGYRRYLGFVTVVLVDLLNL